MAMAASAQRRWDAIPACHRAEVLERAAERMEARTPEFVALIVREGGRTLADAVAEVREALDFLRHYAGQAHLRFSSHEYGLPDLRHTSGLYHNRQCAAVHRRQRSISEAAALAKNRVQTTRHTSHSKGGG